jgi:uncharacterized membrane protein (DUF4010 family)
MPGMNRRDYRCRMGPTDIPADALLRGLALALAIGLLIGVERGWQQRGEQAGSRVAGIRTFAILGLLGGLAGTQIAAGAGGLSLILLGGAVLALVVGFALEAHRSGNVSVTGALAGIVTLALGVLATTGQMALASVGAGATMILLASREPLHQAIRATSAADIRALLRLVLVVFLVLPLLPDQGMGPFDALNPRRLWLVVVVISAISFIGYALARWLGERRGTLLIAIVGALVSSTAVTVDSGRRIRAGAAGPEDNSAVAVASAIMLLRGLFLTAVLAPLAFARVLALIGPAALVAILIAALLLWRSNTHSDGIALPEVKAPGLGLALLFAGSVAFISVVTAWAQTRFGSEGGAVVIALGGTADNHAAIAAVGARRPRALSPDLAALAIAAPVLYNTFFKGFVLMIVARSRRALPGVAALTATSIALAIPIAIALF